MRERAHESRRPNAILIHPSPGQRPCLPDRHGCLPAVCLSPCAVRALPAATRISAACGLRQDALTGLASLYHSPPDPHGPLGLTNGPPGGGFGAPGRAAARKRLPRHKASMRTADLPNALCDTCNRVAASRGNCVIRAVAGYHLCARTRNSVAHSANRRLSGCGRDRS
jgi:hypothetical protein